MNKNKFWLVLFSFLFAFNTIFANNLEELQIKIEIDELINCCGEDFIEDIGIILYDLHGNIIGEKNVSAEELENGSAVIFEGVKTSSDCVIVVIKSKNGTKIIKKILLKK